MPIQRFGSTLISKGIFHEYMNLLKNAYTENNLNSLMCKSLISIDWRGYVYDCDFNQMLGLPILIQGKSHAHLSDLLEVDLENREISVADHCYGMCSRSGK